MEIKRVSTNLLRIDLSQYELDVMFDMLCCTIAPHNGGVDDELMNVLAKEVFKK